MYIAYYIKCNRKIMIILSCIFLETVSCDIALFCGYSNNIVKYSSIIRKTKQLFSYHTIVTQIRVKRV